MRYRLGEGINQMTIDVEDYESAIRTAAHIARDGDGLVRVGATNGEFLAYVAYAGPSREERAFEHWNECPTCQATGDIDECEALAKIMEGTA